MKIVIADDHPILREGLVKIIASEPGPGTSRFKRKIKRMVRNYKIWFSSRLSA